VLADRCRGNRTHLARVLRVGSREVTVPERPAFAFRDARMATRAVLREHRLPARDSAFAELLFQLEDEIGAAVARSRIRRLAGPGPGGGQVGLVRLGRSEEIKQILQAILDRPEVRAIAPALPDVERRLAKAALLRVDLAHVGEVIDPALLGA
jgi:hypothetical protein